jgi:hypothetical protein
MDGMVDALWTAPVAARTKRRSRETYHRNRHWKVQIVSDPHISFTEACACSAI